MEQVILDQGDIQGFNPVYAGFWERVGARIIDGLIMAIPGMFFSFIPFWLYRSLMESGKGQSSLGQRAVGIVVVKENGEQISFGQGTGRFFGGILSSLILCIGHLMMLWNDKKQTLHDQMAGTLVIKKSSLPNGTYGTSQASIQQPSPILQENNNTTNVSSENRNSASEEILEEVSSIEDVGGEIIGDGNDVYQNTTVIVTAEGSSEDVHELGVNTKEELQEWSEKLFWNSVKKYQSEENYSGKINIKLISSVTKKTVVMESRVRRLIDQLNKEILTKNLITKEAKPITVFIAWDE